MRHAIYKHREMDRCLGRQLDVGITPHPGFYKSLVLRVNRQAIKCSGYKIFEIFSNISV